MTLRCPAIRANSAIAAQRALFVVACVTLLSRPATAQLLAVNGVSAPGTVVVAAGATVSVTVTSGPGDVHDWVGVYAPGVFDYFYIDWRFLNGTQTAPATGLTSATFNFPLPSTPGDYEFRLFTNNWQRLAVSGVVTGAPPPTVTSVTPSSAHVGDVVAIARTFARPKVPAR